MVKEWARQKKSAFPISIQHLLEILASAIKQGKEIKASRLKKKDAKLFFYKFMSGVGKMKQFL